MSCGKKLNHILKLILTKIKHMSVINAWATISVLLCSLPLADKKVEDYENRVETNPHQMITASKAKKQCLKNVFEQQ